MGYIPLRYTRHAKFGDGHVLGQIVLSDLPVVLLSITIINQPTLYSIAGMLAMFLAFFCVYELGYFENDFVGSETETHPNLLARAEDFRHYRVFPHAWVWALALTAIGALCFQWHYFETDTSEVSFAVGWFRLFCIWTIFLVGVRTLFWVYNTRISIDNRKFLYLALQATKTFGFVLLMPTNLIGSIFLASHALKRWMNYIIYRHGGNNEMFPAHATGIIIFLFLSAVAMIGLQTTQMFFSYQFWLILAWSVIRGIPELQRVLKAKNNFNDTPNEGGL